MHPPILRTFCILLSLGGCTRVDAADDRPVPERQTSGIALESPMPGPNRGRLQDAVRQNEACIVCHDEQAAEWRGSLHQRSDVDPAYRHAFALEPMPFCRGCHAPEADPHQEPPRSVSELGVGCVTCHVTEDGLVLAAPSTITTQAPHPLRRSPNFARTGGCVNCHEFTFPGISAGAREDDSLFMQTTVREHARSSAANTPCADCHMPIVAGRRAHSFASVRDPDWLRKNIAVNAGRGENDTVEVTIRQTNSGHAFPTGDLFRRLEISAELREKGGHVIRRDVVYPARHFVQRKGASGRELVRDDRIFDEALTFDMDVAPVVHNDKPLYIFYWVKLQRVANVGEGSRAQDAVVESEVELHKGEFLW